MTNHKTDNRTTANADDAGKAVIGVGLLVLAFIGARHLLTSSSDSKPRYSPSDRRERDILSRLAEEDL